MKITIELNPNQLKILHSGLTLYIHHLNQYGKHWSSQGDYKKWANAEVARVQTWDLVGQIFEQVDPALRP